VNTFKYVTKGLEVGDTSLTDAKSSNTGLLYQCPSNFTARITFLHISSGSSNNKKISINLNDASLTADHLLLDEHAVSANTEHDVVAGGSLLYLDSGDALHCFKESGGDFHVTISVEELYTPSL
tara:strand:- start:274 stop:645 length:372 start_codon:yes stop_codon:yes gene_type:complete